MQCPERGSRILAKVQGPAPSWCLCKLPVWPEAVQSAWFRSLHGVKVALYYFTRRGPWPWARPARSPAAWAGLRGEGWVCGGGGVCVSARVRVHRDALWTPPPRPSPLGLKLHVQPLLSRASPCKPTVAQGFLGLRENACGPRCQLLSLHRWSTPTAFSRAAPSGSRQLWPPPAVLEQVNCRGLSTPRGHHPSACRLTGRSCKVRGPPGGGWGQTCTPYPRGRVRVRWDSESGETSPFFRILQPHLALNLSPGSLAYGGRTLSCLCAPMPNVKAETELAETEKAA